MDPVSIVVLSLLAGGSAEIVRRVVRGFRQRDENQRRVWQLYAQRVGGHVDDPKGHARSMSLYVERHEALVRVRRMSPQRRNGRASRTIVEAQHAAQGMPSYHLYWDYAAGQLKVTLTKDHLLGHARVDHDYVFTSRDPDRARPFLAPVLEAIDAIGIDPLIELLSDGQRVRAYLDGVLLDEDVLERVVELVGWLASAEQHTGLGALRELGGAQYQPERGEFGDRQAACAVLSVRGVEVSVGPRQGTATDATAPSTAARALWPHELGDATVDIDEAGAVSGDTETLAVGDGPERRALCVAVGSARLELFERQLSLLWPAVVEDRRALLAGAQLVGELCAVTTLAGAYR